MAEEIEEIMDEECQVNYSEAYISVSAQLIRRAFNHCHGYEKLAKALKSNVIPSGFFAYIDIGTSLGNRLPKYKDYIALIKPGGGNLNSTDKNKDDIIYAQEILDFHENPLWEECKIQIWHKILRQIITDLYIDDIIKLPYITENCTGITIMKL